jgi:hypothetical protein
MRTSLYWEEFAEVTVTRLVRPEPGDPFLIIINTAGDISLAEACLAAGMRAGADTQLIVKPRPARGAPSRKQVHPGVVQRRSHSRPGDR